MKSMQPQMQAMQTMLSPKPPKQMTPVNSTKSKSKVADKFAKFKKKKVMI